MTFRHDFCKRCSLEQRFTLSLRRHDWLAHFAKKLIVLTIGGSASVAALLATARNVGVSRTRVLHAERVQQGPIIGTIAMQCKLLVNSTDIQNE